MTNGMAESFWRWPIASQMYFRELAHAKSRTFAALNRQVRIAVVPLVSLASASAGVTMNTGLSAVSACFRRARCAGVSTASGFCSTPVEATM